MITAGLFENIFKIIRPYSVDILVPLRRAVALHLHLPSDKGAVCAAGQVLVPSSEVAVSGQHAARGGTARCPDDCHQGATAGPKAGHITGTCFIRPRSADASRARNGGLVTPDGSGALSVCPATGGGQATVTAATRGSASLPMPPPLDKEDTTQRRTPAPAAQRPDSGSAAEGPHSSLTRCLRPGCAICTRGAPITSSLLLVVAPGEGLGVSSDLLPSSKVLSDSLHRKRARLQEQASCKKRGRDAGPPRPDSAPAPWISIRGLRRGTTKEP